MKISGLRWLMIGLIFLATVINYIDRQTVSVLKTSISQDLGLSNADYAAIQNSFLLFYGISQMVSGRLYDVIGTRLGFVFSIVVWSLAALAHATARTATAFGVFRAALDEGVERFTYVSSSMVFENATQYPTREDYLPQCPTPTSAWPAAAAVFAPVAPMAG